MTHERAYLKEWRKFRSLTQQAAADAIDSSKGYISDLENGKRRYNQDILEALAELYMCDPADLLSQDPSEPEAEAEIVSIWDRIPRDSQAAARAMLESLTKNKA